MLHVPSAPTRDWSRLIPGAGRPSDGSRAPTIGWKLNLAKTHCPQGHPYEGRNLVVKRGHRHCRECELAQSRDYYRRHVDEIRAQKSARRAATKQKAEAT